MSSTDNQPLYAAREPIFPRRVKGFYRTLKWWVMAVTLGIYYLTPWIRWDRGPNLPDQAVLMDMAGRRFYFFWIEIWPHEFYFVAGLLIMAGLGLFLFTSALGRVWCGYTCPQTVWTDLFILVERWIEGDRNARVRLWNAKWDFRKARLRLTKWTVWLLISVATGGAWVFYFADAPTLLASLANFSAPPIAWATIGVLTATTFVFGGFMREQVCNYMCPWPRIQAAMMDPETLTVAYREWRGEPRGKKRIEGAGDCIDCMACVNVCPAGIDIRDGQQME
ncbi:MAG: cytochrome c oxidase accessory protein CcoG, partial [Paracoccaceae bacterium]|nr:cytochrome c oxidase accessory protein CcoG [Paracoccaceae bacterium]